MKRAFLYRAAAAAFTGAVLALSVLPDVDAPEAFSHVDKAYHFSAYLVMAWLWAGAFSDSSFFREKGGAPVVAASFGLSFAFGAAIEVIQSYIPYRDAEALDLVANGVGALAGAFVQTYIHRLKGGQGHET